MNGKQQCQTLNGALSKIGELDGKLDILISKCTSEIFLDSGDNVEKLKKKLKEAKNSILEAKGELQNLANDLVNNSPWW